MDKSSVKYMLLGYYIKKDIIVKKFNIEIK